MKLDPSKFNVRLWRESDDLSHLNCKEPDGSDPLGVQEFLEKKAVQYHKSRLCSLFVTTYEQKPVGFFALCMSAIESPRLAADEKVNGYTPRSYPAMLLAQMGVNLPFRNHGIGVEIRDFCLGIAVDIGERVACRYVILQTNEHLSNYYRKHWEFIKQKNPPQRGRVWMYRRVA